MPRRYKDPKAKARWDREREIVDEARKIRERYNSTVHQQMRKFSNRLKKYEKLDLSAILRRHNEPEWP